uniref:MYND-type domain-containing protein n=1 Tax=Anopheles epiroticus TaxID=199890 RepID=A0A182P360_9DIPT
MSTGPGAFIHVTMDSKQAGSGNITELFEILWQCKIKDCLERARKANLNAPEASEFFIEEVFAFVRNIPSAPFLNLSPEVKSDVAALAFRAKGNEMYHPTVRNFMEAVKFFNESIAYSEKGSVERAISYANRSIVCMELFLYEDCLENIRLARESNYPTHFLVKLAEREAKAKEALQHVKTPIGSKSKSGRGSAKDRRTIGQDGPHITKFDCMSTELWETMLKHKLAQANREELQPHEMYQFLVREISDFVRSYPYRQRLDMVHPDGKDDAKAETWRAKGNEMFHPKEKNYFLATAHYNASIAHAQKGSKARAIAYANRSAVCVKLGRYEDCLENIRLARESNYPASMMVKLDKREAMVKSLQAAEQIRRSCNNWGEEEEPEKLTLSYQSHPNAPQMVDCIELHQNQQFGRHVVASAPLQVGDVLIIEEPYVTVLNSETKYLRCAFCHTEEPCLLIPCEECTIAMYCSQKCLRAAWQQYHQYECPILRDIDNLGSPFLLIAVRLVIKAICTFEHDLEALRKHLSHLDVSKVNPFNVNWKKASSKDMYDAVYALATNQTKHNPKSLSHYILEATIAHDLLLKRTKLGQVCKADSILKKSLFNLIIRHLQSMIVNSQVIWSMHYATGLARTYEQLVYASGCFPLLSMFNHSCASNVERFCFRDGRCALVVSRPIAKGAQIFQNYQIHHWTQSLEIRQFILFHNFGFRCLCEACVKDYGALDYYLDNPCNEEDFMDIGRISYELKQHSREKALKWLPLLRSALNKIDSDYPSYKTASLQALLFRCYQIIYSRASCFSNSIR